MNSAGYGVGPEELKQHSKTVADLAERVGTAAKAADKVGSLDASVAYGALAAPFVQAGFELFVPAYDDLISKYADFGKQLSDKISSGSQNYDDLEEEAKDLFK